MIRIKTIDGYVLALEYDALLRNYIAIVFEDTHFNFPHLIRHKDGVIIYIWKKHDSRVPNLEKAKELFQQLIEEDKIKNMIIAQKMR